MDVVSVVDVHIQPQPTASESVIEDEKLDIDVTTLDRAPFEALAGIDERCQICFDNIDTNEAFQLSDCKHYFCRECIANFVRYKIADGNVYPKCCYCLDTSAEDSANEITNNKPKFCDNIISHTDICNILDADLSTMEKYIRFKFCKENKDARECPKCNTFTIGTPQVSPRITCSKCSHLYCFYHANAHDFARYPTCAEYEASVAEEQKESEALIASEAKKCPGCGMMVLKSGGCNHMKCQCGVAFCWLCGKAIDDSLFPAHFQWWNPIGCANLQMSEAQQPSPLTRTCARACALVELILFGPLTLLSTATSLLLCAPCILLQTRRDTPPSLRAYLLTLAANCMSVWGVFWMLLLFFLPLAISLAGLVAAVGVSVGTAIYPCYCSVRLYQGSYPWPDTVTRRASRAWGRMSRFTRRMFERMYVCMCGCCGAQNRRNDSTSMDSNGRNFMGGGKYDRNRTLNSRNSQEAIETEENRMEGMAEEDIETGRVISNVGKEVELSEDETWDLVLSALEAQDRSDREAAEVVSEEEVEKRKRDKVEAMRRKEDVVRQIEERRLKHTDQAAALSTSISTSTTSNPNSNAALSSVLTSPPALSSSSRSTSQQLQPSPSAETATATTAASVGVRTHVEVIDRSLDRMWRILDDLDHQRTTINSSSNGHSSSAQLSPVVDLLFDALPLSRQSSRGSNHGNNGSNHNNLNHYNHTNTSNLSSHSNTANYSTAGDSDSASNPNKHTYSLV